MTILFLHGWTSVPGGVKPTYLSTHGHTVINPKLPDEDFARAIRITQAEFDRHRPQVVVGSSRGGAVAMNIDSGDTKLVLLCPAWNGQDGEARHGHPSQPWRRRGAVLGLGGTRRQQRTASFGTDRCRYGPPARRPGAA